jgi:hypothetical protein
MITNLLAMCILSLLVIPVTKAMQVPDASLISEVTKAMQISMNMNEKDRLIFEHSLAMSRKELEKEILKDEKKELKIKQWRLKSLLVGATGAFLRGDVALSSKWRDPIKSYIPKVAAIHSPRYGSLLMSVGFTYALYASWMIQSNRVHNYKKYNSGLPVSIKVACEAINKDLEKVN